ncbi:MAG: molybdopterin synthase sulfur carrier subunit [Flavobacteriaceae bacterium]|nr:MAG: molybdopterin synthase sulfur carrier subunit [Flavobacteriaceae bacterium]
MKCNLLLFGIAAEIVGTNELTIDIVKDSNVLGLKKILIDTYVGFKNVDQFAIAVNESYASDETVIEKNDIIAIIPPVSGG